MAVDITFNFFDSLKFENTVKPVLATFQEGNKDLVKRYFQENTFLSKELLEYCYSVESLENLIDSQDALSLLSLLNSFFIHKCILEDSIPDKLKSALSDNHFGDGLIEDIYMSLSDLSEYGPDVEASLTILDKLNYEYGGNLNQFPTEDLIFVGYIKAEEIIVLKNTLDKYLSELTEVSLQVTTLLELLKLAILHEVALLASYSF